MKKTAKPKDGYEYDPKRRKLAKIYSKQKLIMGISNGLVLPLVTVAILYLSGYLEKLATWSLATGGSFWGIVLFILTINILSSIIEFPLSLYSGYYYEHKYHLSNQTIGAWLKDYAKEFSIGMILITPFEVFTAWLMMTTPLWWLYVTLIGSAYGLLINFLYPVLILPLLYKLEPYKDKAELKNIWNIIKKAGATDIKYIKVLKESEKSEKVNAFVTGIGHTRTVVLYDTLLAKLTRREIRATIAHELGHHVYKHVQKSMIISAIKSFIMLFAVDKLMRYVFSVTTAGYPLSLVIVVSSVMGIIGFLIMPLSNAYSRRREVEADMFALDIIKDPLAFISLERRLEDIDLGDENPHPLVTFWFGSHPTGKQREDNYRAWMKEHSFKG